MRSQRPIGGHDAPQPATRTIEAKRSYLQPYRDRNEALFAQPLGEAWGDSFFSTRDSPTLKLDCMNSFGMEPFLSME